MFKLKAASKADNSRIIKMTAAEGAYTLHVGFDRVERLSERRKNDFYPLFFKSVAEYLAPQYPHTNIGVTNIMHEYSGRDYRKRQELLLNGLLGVPYQPECSPSLKQAFSQNGENLFLRPDHAILYDAGENMTSIQIVRNPLISSMMTAEIKKINEMTKACLIKTELFINAFRADRLPSMKTELMVSRPLVTI